MTIDITAPASWFPAGPAAVAALTALRESLHRNPELSFEEHQTTERLIAAAEGFGLSAANGVEIQRFSGTGLSIRIPGTDAGGTSSKTVAVRGDIDALPIQEEARCAFASTVPGVMHACGHDVHASWALGAASLIAREPAAGDVVVVLQPAEETGLGAATVVESGVLDDVAMIFGAHVDPRWVVGEAVVQAGPVAAATDEFSITIHGAGGHGARPQLGRDPTVAAAALVMELQTIVSRRVTPGDPAVVTVGELHAGTAPNIIPEQARIAGTLRSTSTATRELLRAGVQQLAAGIANSFSVRCEVGFGAGTPPVVNDEKATQHAATAAEQWLGKAALRALPEPNMGGEDFAVYLETMPGCFLRIGSRLPDDPIVGAHTPQFYARTECVFVGAVVLAEAARRASRG